MNTLGVRSDARHLVVGRCIIDLRQRQRHFNKLLFVSSIHGQAAIKAGFVVSTSMPPRVQSLSCVTSFHPLSRQDSISNLSFASMAPDSTSRSICTISILVNG